MGGPRRHHREHPFALGWAISGSAPRTGRGSSPYSLAFAAPAGGGSPDMIGRRRTALMGLLRLRGRLSTQRCHHRVRQLVAAAAWGVRRDPGADRPDTPERHLRQPKDAPKRSPSTGAIAASGANGEPATRRFHSPVPSWRSGRINLAFALPRRRRANLCGWLIAGTTAATPSASRGQRWAGCSAAPVAASNRLRLERTMTVGMLIASAVTADRGWSGSVPGDEETTLLPGSGRPQPRRVHRLLRSPSAICSPRS